MFKNKDYIQLNSKEHIWKSCIPQKGIEGSNPSFSAIRMPGIH